VINDKMSANFCRDTATSAIWNVTVRPWLTTFAAVLSSSIGDLAQNHRRRQSTMARRRTGRRQRAQRFRFRLWRFKLCKDRPNGRMARREWVTVFLD
jgi:hypothetical protein